MADGNENQAPEKLQGKFQAKVICCILGIGGLASWNSLLTIADYYYKVFPDYHPSRVLVVYQPFALGTIVILAYHGNLDLTTRGRGGVGPYIGLCAIVASFGLADATVQGGMIGDLSLMCPELIQSFMAGLGVAGALTSAFRLMTKAAFENSNDGLRKGAMIFLAISAFIQFLCVMLYAYVFPKLPIVKYYRRKAASEGSKTVTADLAAAGIKNQSYFAHYKKTASVPKKKGRLVGLGRRTRSVPPSSAPPPFVDPEVLTAQLKDKDDRISLLETQMAAQQAGYEAQRRLNQQMMEMMQRMYPNEVFPDVPDP
ncbi:hypothetical protein DY000_02014027 [Brassica cretica]|uniref:Uncharacterized protein n=1 Tax=Brassica cretica TaxID=69181 RepID=A0ABQ7CWK8_BRACR|nr:hypothetical protein DY000_02014027 [Brassica cretica]